MTWGRAYTGLARGDVQNYTKSMLVLVQYGLLVCTAHLSGVLVGTVLKCIASLAFVILLIFVVRRSEHILKVVTIFLCALPAKTGEQRSAARWKRTSPALLILQPDPELSPLFQRPPPLF